MCVLIRYNILLNPFRVRFPTTCRAWPRVLWRGVARRVVLGKKFVVPGGNEAMTNEISPGGERPKRRSGGKAER